MLKVHITVYVIIMELIRIKYGWVGICYISKYVLEYIYLFFTCQVQEGPI